MAEYYLTLIYFLFIRPIGNLQTRTETMLTYFLSITLVHDIQRQRITTKHCYTYKNHWVFYICLKYKSTRHSRLLEVSQYILVFKYSLCIMGSMYTKNSKHCYTPSSAARTLAGNSLKECPVFFLNNLSWVMSVGFLLQKDLLITSHSLYYNAIS